MAYEVCTGWRGKAGTTGMVEWMDGRRVSEGSAKQGEVGSQWTNQST